MCLLLNNELDRLYVRGNKTQKEKHYMFTPIHGIFKKSNMQRETVIKIAAGESMERNGKI